MSGSSRARSARVNTVRALLVGRGFLGAMEPVVLTELEEVKAVERVPQMPRRHLLQVLHATRALDTAMSVFVHFAGCPGGGSSLGKYLYRLTQPGSRVAQLPIASRRRYQGSIVDTRNRYAHEAGAFPASDQELAALLSEMEACVSEVVAL